MPRAPRSDLEPEILLPDNRSAEQLTRNAIGPDYGFQLWRMNERRPRDGWFIAFDEIQTRLAYFRQENAGIDEGLLYMMMSMCSMASVLPQKDEYGNSKVKKGMLVHILKRVGCRVEMTQGEIARMYGVERQTVNKQIQKLKKFGFIVNSGDGWYEFDASLCWRGEVRIHKAYVRQQKIRDGLVITDGKTTITTPSMDDDVMDDGEDH